MSDKEAENDVPMEQPEQSEQEEQPVVSVAAQKLELLKQVNEPAYNWVYLTQDFIDNLKDGGSIKELANKVKEQPELAVEVFTEVLYSIKFFTSRIELAELNSLLTEIVTVRNPKPFFLKFISVFNTFEKDDNLLKLLSLFQKLPYEEMAKFLMDESLISKLNVVNNYTNVKRSIIFDKLRAKKYNLTYEANEGFSKLIVFLTESFESDESAFMVDYTIRGMDLITGHYNLDPIRVLDIILDISSVYCTKNYRFCIDFLKKTRWWPVNNESDCSSLENLDKGGCTLATKLISEKLKSRSKTSKPLTEGYKILAVLLIKEGFISFGQLFKLVDPSEEDMDKLKAKIKLKIEDEIFKASANALALSGPLADDSEEEDTDKGKQNIDKDKKHSKQKDADEKDEIPNTKLILLHYSLCLGLYWPSIYILSKYPYLVDADDDIPKLIMRLFKECLKPITNQISILSETQKLQLSKTKKNSIFKDDSVYFEDLKLATTEVYNPFQEIGGLKHYIFFYHEWNKDLPQIENFDDLVKISNEILFFISSKWSNDLELFSLISKFGVLQLNQIDKNDENYQTVNNDWFDYFRKYIFPASSIIEENPLASYDFFELLRKFPIQSRYNLYGELLNVISKNNNDVKLHYSKAEKETKDILKRITKENVKPMMRRLAKISFSNPLPSFMVIISQVESYDNLSNLIVDSARYFTDYAWDILPFVLLTRLTAPRNSIQKDGMNDAQWLQSLSTFIAKLSKRYSSMNLEPILTFILKSFHQKKLIGLTILREIVNQMGGIQMSSNLSGLQIKLINSSEVLQKLVFNVILDKREESINPGKRLLNNLISSNQLSELFILLCQYHKTLGFEISKDSYLKIIANQIDELVSVLHSFIELINYFGKDQKDSLKNSLVTVNDLINKYNVDFTWAFELWRNLLNDEDLESIEFDNNEIDFNKINKSFFLTFWKLTLYDIGYESENYDQEELKLKQTLKTLEDNFTFEKNQHVSLRSRSLEDIKTEKDRTSKLLDRIPIDKSLHEVRYNKVLESFNEIKDEIFKDTEQPVTEEIEFFIQYCLLPRSIQSSTDAVFASEFLIKVLGLKFTNLIIEHFFNNDILDTIIFTLTPLESENLGLFFAELFKSYEVIRTKKIQGEGSDVESSKEELNDIKKLYYNWNEKLFEIIKIAIEDEEYMSRKNCFTFLKNLVGVYPIIKDHGENIVKLIELVLETETREDLKLASNAILALIKSKSKKWINKWDFYDMDEELKSKLQDERLELEAIEQELKQEARLLKMIENEKIREEKERKRRLEYEEYEKLKLENQANQANQETEEAEISNDIDMDDIELEEKEDQENVDADDHSSDELEEGDAGDKEEEDNNEEISDEEKAESREDSLESNGSPDEAGPHDAGKEASPSDPAKAELDDEEMGDEAAEEKTDRSSSLNATDGSEKSNEEAGKILSEIQNAIQTGNEAKLLFAIKEQALKLKLMDDKKNPSTYAKSVRARMLNYARTLDVSKSQIDSFSRGISMDHVNKFCSNALNRANNNDSHDKNDCHYNNYNSNYNNSYNGGSRYNGRGNVYINPARGARNDSRSTPSGSGTSGSTPTGPKRKPLPPQSESRGFPPAGNSKWSSPAGSGSERNANLNNSNFARDARGSNPRYSNNPSHNQPRYRDGNPSRGAARPGSGSSGGAPPPPPPPGPAPPSNYTNHSSGQKRPYNSSGSSSGAGRNGSGSRGPPNKRYHR